MEAKLSTKEIEAIAKLVTDQLHAKFVADGSQKELQKACENYTKQMIDFYVSENSVSYDVAKMIEPIFEEHLKQTKIVEQQLLTYLNTDHFKKIELRHLKSRVNQIEQELFENDN